MQQLVTLSVDFTQASLEVRETLSYSAEQATALLQRGGRMSGVREAAILSTCNRTEFYLVCDDDTVPALWLELVREERRGSPVHDATCRLSRSIGVDAARHLFRVACGLESLLLGDAHIASQVRRAFSCAADAGTLGPVLSETFRQATDVMREARATTDISRGVASLGAAVADLVAAHRDAAGRPLTVLLLGAGTIARECARYLAKRPAGDLVLTSRTTERAERLARASGGTARPWSQLKEAIADADVLITALATDVPVLTRALLGCEVGLDRAQGRSRPALILDLGVPRNVEAGVAANVLTIDEVTGRRDESLSKRRNAVPMVERLIDAQIDDWLRWQASRPREAVIKALFADEVRQRTALTSTLAPTLGVDADTLDAILRRFSGSLLRGHARALRQIEILHADAPTASWV